MSQRSMEEVLRESAKAAEASKKKRKKEEKEIIYGENGKILKSKMGKAKKGFLIAGGVIVCFAGSIYLPAAFYTPSSSAAPYRTLVADETALKTYQQYIKDHPDADFDQDGLTNAMEENYGTNIWSSDTDKDGVSDYAELFVTETSPTQASSILVDQVAAQDKKNGDTVRTPYKVDDITFWPDNYSSKAYGAIVRTIHGYRFWNYSGWVKFPGTVYAYSYVDGIHTPLPHREQEDAWYISSSAEVRIYDTELPFVNELKLPFIGSVYLEDSGLGNMLSKVPPSEGSFITCEKKAVKDTEPDISSDVVADIALPEMDFTDLSRFSENQNTLKDLSTVRKYIEAGRCVAVSFYSESSGESIGIVYGYTDDGDLLIAGTDLVPAGVLKITECAMKIMNKDGVIGQTSWFEFAGLGFNSNTQKDRINFFATAKEGSKNNVSDPSGIEAESTVIPDAVLETESQTEVTAEEDSANNNTETNEPETVTESGAEISETPETSLQLGL